MSNKLAKLETILKERKKAKTEKKLNAHYQDIEDGEFVFPTGDLTRQIDFARSASPLKETWRQICRI